MGDNMDNNEFARVLGSIEADVKNIQKDLSTVKDMITLNSTVSKEALTTLQTELDGVEAKALIANQVILDKFARAERVALVLLGLLGGGLGGGVTAFLPQIKEALGAVLQ
jgi:hypothetical protein